MARVGYERLSKDRSLRAINVQIQRDEIDDYAESTGEPISRHFCDNNKSASEFGTKVRDDYLALIEAVKHGLVTEIIVTEIPRLSRESDDAGRLIRLSKATNLRYISTTDGARYDLTTPRGRKGLRDAFSDAEFESDQSSSRQHRKKGKDAAAGKFHGGNRGYGYQGPIRDPEGILLNPGKVGRALVPSEVAVIRECVKRVITANEREVDIVRDLNRRGIKTAEGAKWRGGNLRVMLLKKKHVQWQDTEHGTRVHHGTEYEGQWPYIITAQEHSLMLAAFKLRAINTQRGLINGRQYPYSGILRCGKCGQPMYGNGRTMKNGVSQRRYVCRRFDNHGEVAGCGGVFRAADPLELLIGQAVIYRFDSPEVAAALAPPEDTARVRELVDLHTAQKLRLDQLVADYGAGILNRDELIIAKSFAQQALDNTVRELGKVQSHRADAELPPGQMLADVWEHSSVDWKRRITLLVVDHVVVEPGNPGSQLWEGWHFDPTKIRIVWRH